MVFQVDPNSFPLLPPNPAPQSHPFSAVPQEPQQFAQPQQFVHPQQQGFPFEQQQSQPFSGFEESLQSLQQPLPSNSWPPVRLFIHLQILFLLLSHLTFRVPAFWALFHHPSFFRNISELEDNFSAQWSLLGPEIAFLRFSERV